MAAGSRCWDRCATIYMSASGLTPLTSWHGYHWCTFFTFVVCPRSILVIKYPDKSGEKGFIWLTVSGCSPSLQQSQGRNLKYHIHSQEQRASRCGSLLFLFLHTQGSSLVYGATMVSWVLPCQVKSIVGLSMGQPDLSNPSLMFLS